MLISVRNVRVLTESTAQSRSSRASRVRLSSRFSRDCERLAASARAWSAAMSLISRPDRLRQDGLRRRLAMAVARHLPPRAEHVQPVGQLIYLGQVGGDQ